MALGIISVRLVETPDYTVLYEGIHTNTDIEFALRITSEKEKKKLFEQYEYNDTFSQYLLYIPDDIFEQRELLFFSIPIYTDEEEQIKLERLEYNGTCYRADFTQQLIGQNQKGDAYVCMLTVEKGVNDEKGVVEQEILTAMQIENDRMYAIGNTVEIKSLDQLEKNLVVLHSVEEMKAYTEELAQQLVRNSQSVIERYIELYQLDYKTTMIEVQKNALDYIETELGNQIIPDESFFETQVLCIYQRCRQYQSSYVKIKISEEEKKLEIVESDIDIFGGMTSSSSGWLTWIIKKLMGKKSVDPKSKIWEFTEIAIPRNIINEYEIIVK